MNTKFDVTLVKKNGLTYGIDLGQDILMDIDDKTIRELASSSEIIKCQSPLRTLKDIVDAASMETYLRKTYPMATVTDGTIKEESDATKAKKFAAELVEKYGSVEAGMAKLKEMMATDEVATDEV